MQKIIRQRGTGPRATSCRNTGRHHLGTPGRLRRNPHVAGMPEIIATLAWLSVGTNEPIRRHKAGTVRAETLRRKALNLLNGISIGLRSGEYCGRYCSVAPAASIASFTPGTLCAGRLSITTISLRLSVGARHCAI